MTIQPPETLPVRHRRKPTQHPRRFVFWTIVVVGVLILMAAAGFGVGSLVLAIASSGDTPSQPVPTMQAAPNVPSTFAPSATPTATPLAIAPSEITQLKIPAYDPNATGSAAIAIDAPVIQLRTLSSKAYCNDKQGISPPPDGPQWADAFQCSAFGMPGTTGRTNAVLAGHTLRGAQTVMNRLFDQYKAGTPLVNRTVLIRTATSGSHWLLYKIQDVSTPLKKDFWPLLQTQRAIPGRLVIVTCVQHPSNTESTNNLVVVAEFMGVQ